MNKRKQAALDTRKKLLEVGERLIAERGFDNVSVEDITEESGVSKGTFYTYFPHKEDIVYHISLDAFDGLKEEILAMKDTGIAERLRRYTYKFMECVEHYGIMICRQWVRNEICEDDCGKLIYDLSSLRYILEAAVAEGKLSEDAPVETLTYMITSGLYGMMTCWCMSGGKFEPKDHTDEFFFAGLEKALAPYVTE